ncbi:hypothetical protein J4H86_18740 [Spiractinospora alimapuensis]|uniref:hypothetical protein n=1 Tax=Spiractinospora alimapuensis TaxID=2820884 RepID=UPI001F3E79AA|nr:hypothetical protein [Spiractinospora alimapuensis]QVQ50883.1 hypothetical protein J4H86_18740 [Spiractinospora alimapuensis]
MSTPPTRPWWTTALWLVHALLRGYLFVHLMVYGWSKLLFIQMGFLDYAEALYTIGEKSPMGLLWTFTAYSPAFQFLSGLVEVIAGVLLIWRRTVWLGGLLGAGAMGFVFLLNLFYDVPVKLLALLLAVVALLVLAPEMRRLTRFVLGRDPGEPVIPRPIPWPAVHRVTRWVFGTIGVAIVVGPIAFVTTYVPQESDPGLAGVYRVVEDTREPADQLADDTRWQEVAFGQYESMNGGTWQFTLRYANGDLHEGFYETADDDTVEVSLYPIMDGDRPPQPGDPGDDLPGVVQGRRRSGDAFRRWGGSRPGARSGTSFPLRPGVLVARNANQPLSARHGPVHQ